MPHQHTRHMKRPSLRKARRFFYSLALHTEEDARAAAMQDADIVYDEIWDAIRKQQEAPAPRISSFSEVRLLMLKNKLERFEQRYEELKATAPKETRLRMERLIKRVESRLRSLELKDAKQAG